LLIDPVGYDPTKQTSLTFTHIKPLHVTGDGALFSIPYVYSDKLTVDTDTLYVDSLNKWVGIGTMDFTSGTKFKVSGGTVQVGTEEVSIVGRAVSGYSSDDVGIYGGAGVNGVAGVYGLRMADSGWAVRGIVDGTSIDQVGVMGESADGYGIYATSSAADQAAVYARNYSSGWAGYFDGRLGANSDVVGQIFYPTGLQRSLVPFTAGQKVAEYPVSNEPKSTFSYPSMAFDGSNIWVTNVWDDIDDNKLFKMRASDGEHLGSYSLPEFKLMDIAYDGSYLWASDYYGEVVKIDTQDGSVLANCNTLGAQNNWGTTPYDIVVSDIRGEVFIWTVNSEGGDVTKIDSSCNQIGVYPMGTTGAGDHLNRLNNDGWRVQPYGIIFADGYMWSLLPNVCEDVGKAPYTEDRLTCIDDSDCEGICSINTENLLKIDPATGSVVERYATGLATPARLLSDGMYIWIITSLDVTENKLAKVRMSDGRLMGTYDMSKRPVDLVFDGTYVWISGRNGEGDLVRVAAHSGDATTYVEVLPDGADFGRLLYDGTYVWHVSKCDEIGCNVPLNLLKFYSGTGMGHTDLNSVVNLDPASQQTGSINVAGSAEVGTDTTVGADLDVTGNQWGGSDVTVSVSSGTAECPNNDEINGYYGYFIKGITLDIDSKISEIVCRGL